MLYEIGNVKDNQNFIYLIGPDGIDLQSLEDEYHQTVNPNRHSSFVYWLVRNKGFKRPTITTYFYG